MQGRLSYHPLVWTLLLGTVIVALANNMVLPFLAIYLANTSDLSPMWIGIAIGAGPLASTFGGFIGGTLSDRFGRRVVMLVSVFVIALAFVGFANSEHVVSFVLLNAVFGWFRSCFEPPSQALMVELTQPEQRVKVFGLRYMAINIGAAVGPLLGAYFGITHAQMGFYFAAVVYALYGLVLVLQMSRHELPAASGGRQKVTFRAAFAMLKQDIPVRWFLFGGILINLAYSQVSSTLPQYLGSTITDGVILYSILLSINAVQAVVLQVPISSWAEKRPLMYNLRIGSLLFAVGYLGFAFSWDTVTFILSMVVLTLGELFVFPMTGVMIDQLADDEMRGTYFGAFQFRSIGTFAGPGLGGALLTGWDGHVLFVVTSAVVACSALCYIGGQRSLDRRQASQTTTTSI